MAAAAQGSLVDRVLGAVRGFGRSHHSDPAAAAPAPAPLQLTQKATRSRAIAGAGTRIAAGVIDDIDPNRELRGSKWYGEPGKIGVSQRMMRDGHVRKSVGYLIDPIAAGLWFFKPGSKDPRAIEAAALCQHGFIDSQDWASVLRIGLATPIRDGVGMAEMTDDVVSIDPARFPLHPGRGQAILPTGFHQIQASSVRRWNQRKGRPTELESIQQQLVGSDAETPGLLTIPSDRFIRWTVDQEGGNFAGLALLRSAYGAYKLKLAFLTIRAIRLERQGVGIPMVDLPEDTTEADIEAAEQILAEMRAHEKGFAIWPFGYKFQWSVPGGSMGGELEAAIESCNRDIAYNVGAGFMLLGLQGKTGSFALAQSQDGNYQVGLEGWARFFAVPFNRGVDGWSPVKRITVLNYGEDVAPPILCVRNLPTKDWSKTLPLIPNLVNARVLTPDDELEEMIREVMVLPRMHRESARMLRPATEPDAPPVSPPTEPAEEEDDDAEDEEDAADE